MNFSFKQIFFLSFIFSITIQAKASDGKRLTKCADKLAAKKFYAPAADAYEHALQAKKLPADSVFSIKAKLADVYMKTGNTIKAEANYAEVIKDGKAGSPDLLFSYARALQANGKYADAIIYFDVLANTPKGQARPYKAFSQLSKDALAGLPSADNVQSLPFNTNESEYAPAFYNKGLVFTSSRFTADQPTHRIQWNRVLFTDLYSVEEDRKGGFTMVNKLPAPLNSKLNDGAAVFNKAGDEVFFTRNNKKASRRNDLQILQSKFNGTSWSEPAILNFEGVNSNYAHPFLSADGNTLYFSSDVPGGLGGMDIYAIQRMGDGWGTMLNLGKSVNTAGNELFPFVAENGTLYFTSDGQPGYGGLDIFSAKKDGKTFSEPTNLGLGVNSSKDDLSFIADSRNGNAYFSSNRKGDDDIYSVTVTTPATIAAKAAAAKPAEQARSGKVNDKATGIGIGNARVEIFNSASSNTGRFFYTNDHGEFFYTGPIAASDIIRVSKEKYAEKTYMGAERNQVDSLALALDLELANAVPHDSSFIVNVFYDVNQSELNTEALDKMKSVYEKLMIYPNSRIILNGFADAQGKADHNYTLSMKRAKGVEKFLVEQGLSSARIRTNFYGSVKIEDDCRKQPACVVETNQKNRRVEVKVVKD